MPGNNFIENENSGQKPKRLAKDGIDAAVEWSQPDTAVGKNTENNAAGAPSGKVLSTGIFAQAKADMHDYRDVLESEKKRKNDLSEVGQSAGKSEKSGVGASEGNRFWTLKTNLIKEEVTTFVDWKKNIFFLLFCLAIAICVIGGLYVRLAYQEFQAGKESEVLDKEIAAIKTEIEQAKMQTSDADEFRKKLAVASGLLANHVYWTNFFDFLEKNTLSNTHYGSSFSGGLGSSFTFSAVSKSYRDVDDQLRVLRENKMVKSATTESAALGVATVSEETIDAFVSYEIALELSPDIFKKNNE